MKTLAYTTVSILFFYLSGCSIIDQYSYDGESNPRPTLNYFHQQNIANDLDAPRNSLCRIETIRRNYKTVWLLDRFDRASATLIEGRYLITAAHLVTDSSLDTLESINVRCGTKVTSGERIEVTLSRVQLLTQLSIPRYENHLLGSGKADEFDYAFIDLGRIIDSAKSFILEEPPILVAGMHVSIAGYPDGDVANGRMLFQATGSIEDLDKNLMTYKVHTTIGNDGGPIWLNRDGKHYLVAVHLKHSTGRLVTPTLLEDWRAWRAGRD